MAVLNPSIQPARPHQTRSAQVWLVAAALALATVLAYANSLGVPMVFDDKAALTENPSILQLWPLSIPLSPQSGWGYTVEGRPLFNLTLALNYAATGLDLRSYHATNIAIHVAAGLALLGLLRRTLLNVRLPPRYRENATSLAAGGTLFWLLHPLQVESVTYLVQRVESLAGLFCLFALYAFVRAVEPEAATAAAADGVVAAGGRLRRGWATAAWLSCLCGMATKEVVVVLPVLVLLYDRTFIAGSVQAAWRARRGFYLALAATWAMLLWLVLRAGTRGGTFSLSDPAAWWKYWLTQAEAIATYLRLSFWPGPLIFDYGTFWVTLAEVWPQLLLVVALLAATAWAMWRKPVMGFLGAWFFVTLAPASLLPGKVQMIVEHRMYLPLVAVAGLATWLSGAISARWRVGLAIALAVGFGDLVHRRNQDFRSELDLWGDTVVKRPENGRAHGNYGAALYAAGRVEEAARYLQEAVRREPENPATQFNLGLIAARKGEWEAAARYFTEAGRISPPLMPAHFEASRALAKLGRKDEAIAALERALAQRSDYAEAHVSLGALLAEEGRLEQAIAHYRTALVLRPGMAEAEANLGAALLRGGRAQEALDQLRRAVEHEGNLVVARFNLGQAYAAVGRPDLAAAEYAAAVKLDPKHGEANLNLGIAEAQAGRPAEALRYLEAAVTARPDLPEAEHNLANVLAELHRPADAVPHYEAALTLRPTYAAAHYNFGNTLLMLRRVEDARTQFEQALACDAGFAAAREMIQRIDAAAR